MLPIFLWLTMLALIGVLLALLLVVNQLSRMNPLIKKPDRNPREDAAIRNRVLAFVNPEIFLQTNPDLFRQLYGEFGKTIKFFGGTPILLHEYILVDHVLELGFMRNGGRYKLDVTTDELHQPVVTVKRYRHCGGKALVLLTSESPLDSLYGIPLSKEIPAQSLDGHESGMVKPGGKGETGTGQDGFTNPKGTGQEGFTNPKGTGQDGNTNTKGSGEGYPNGLGYVWTDGIADQKGLVSQSDLRRDTCLKVAVLDSGIRFMDRSDFTPDDKDTPCRKTDLGWDFVDNDNVPKDEHPNLHGTRVTNIIRKGCQVATIIPVRVSNDQNVCTLYDVLCGLEYAAYHGARVINASLAFATKRGIYIPLLQASLRRLAYQGILVVCASGNTRAASPADIEAINPIGEGPDDAYTWMQWPACSSMDLDNVIAVTSVETIPRRIQRPGGTGDLATEKMVCELRSKHFVTVGVQANGQQLPDIFGAFSIPAMNDLRGTSFAAPYVTAKIANAIHAGEDVSSRADVLRAIGAVRENDLIDEIRDGMWVNA